MNLVEKAVAYTYKPIPVWNSLLVAELVQAKWESLNNDNSLNQENYSISKTIINASSLQSRKEPIIYNGNEVIYLEYPSKELKSFYDKHGIKTINEDELENVKALLKLREAIALLRKVKTAYFSIIKIVESIQVLKQDYDYIDISYSNPRVPFSIFVSVCSDFSIISSLRVAESILHESMHLKLTLLEGVIDMVKTDTPNVYYSPWRDEKRPAQGILHGLFVFKAIYDFYNLIIDELHDEKEAVKFIENRMTEIKEELSTLTYLSGIPELSKEGKELVINLLK